MPLASRRVETNASKISGSTSGAMPGPLSSTVTEIHGCALRFRRLEWTAILPDGGMAYSALRSRLTKTCTRRSELPFTTSSGVDVIGEARRGGLFVDGHQRPGLVDQMAQRHRLHVLFADAREIHQALADACGCAA